MVEVIQKFPHESFNVFSLIVTGFFFFWAYNAISRFYRAMLLRSAVNTEDAVLIRGIGSYLYYFEGAWPMHAHAILHTRQAEPPKPIKSLVMPFRFQNIQWLDPHLLRLDLTTLVDCSVMILLDVDIQAIRNYFGTDRNINRNFLRIRSLLHAHCLKAKKSSQLDTFTNELADILRIGGLCSVGSRCELIPSGEHSEINIPVQFSSPHQVPRITYSPMDMVGDIELGMEVEPPPLSPRHSQHQEPKHAALLLVPNQNQALRLDTFSLKRPTNPRDEMLRSPSLFLSSARNQSTESRDRVRSSSLEGSVDHPPTQENLVGLDFCLVLLSGGSVPRDSEALEDSPHTISGISEDLRIEEFLIHAEGGLHSVHDVYGVPSQYSRPAEDAKSEEQKSEENDCVICLTEKKDIFLLPCRHMCVCKGCFIHIDKCPVCRTPFNTYVLVQNSENQNGGNSSPRVRGPEGV